MVNDMNPPMREWERAAPLVMSKLDDLHEAIVDVKKAIDHNLETVRAEMYTRIHAAPCADIVEVKADSGKMHQQLGDLERRAMNQEAELKAASRRWFGMGVTIIVLLLSILLQDMFGR